MNLNIESDMKLQMCNLIKFRRFQKKLEQKLVVSEFKMFISKFGFTFKVLWLRFKSILVFKINLDTWMETERISSKKELPSNSNIGSDSQSPVGRVVQSTKTGTVHFQNLIASLKELRHEVDPTQDFKKVQK